MDKIWAPWRMEYILGAHNKNDKSCFLCIDKEKDEEALVIGRSEKAFVVMNRFPYTNGHVMVVPVRHVGRLEDLTDEELLEMMHLTQKMTIIFKEAFNAEGLNIGINAGRAAGAGLEDHIHIHIVPRWFGDTNYMSVIGETRVISEHLLTSYKKLKEQFR